MIINTEVLHATSEDLYIVSALTATFPFENVFIPLEVYRMLIWDFQECKPQYILPKYDLKLQFISLKIITAIRSMKLSADEHFPQKNSIGIRENSIQHVMNDLDSD